MISLSLSTELLSFAAEIVTILSNLTSLAGRKVEGMVAIAVSNKSGEAYDSTIAVTIWSELGKSNLFRTRIARHKQENGKTF